MPVAGTLGELPPGTLLDGRYVVEGQLGRGASGTVLRVRHRDTGRPLALKLLRDPEADAERFRREAQALGMLEHANILSVTDFGLAPEAGGRPYLVTELVEGPTLRDLLARPRDRKRTLAWLEAIASALDHAHAHGIVHRDLKPENVVVRAADGRPLVLDFGLAHLKRRAPGARAGAPADPRLTDDEQLVGTPLYASPEQIRGEEPSPSSDVYSLGVLAYELLAGQPPFSGGVLEILDAHLGDEARRPPELPAELWDIVASALSKMPAERPASAGEFVARLRRADAQLEEHERSRVARRRRALAGLACACLSAAGAFTLRESDLVAALERRSADWLFGLLPPRPADPRLLLVAIDEESLARDSRPLAEWGDRFGELGLGALEAGAAGVAFDLMLPAQVGAAPAFARLVDEHADRLLLGLAAGEDGALTGMDVLDAATLASLQGRLPFGVVNLAHDPDGVCRRGRLRFHAQDGGELPAFALGAARLLEPRAGDGADGLWLQGDLRKETLERVSWHEALRLPAERWRGRLVLVGAEFPGSGDGNHVAPLGGRRVALSGLELQALQTASLLGERPVRPRTAWAAGPLVAALALALAFIGPALGRPGRALLGLLLAVLAAVLLASRALLVGRELAPLAATLVAPAAALVVVGLAALGLRRVS